MSPRFGRERLVRPGVGIAARTLYRLMGLADPAHWLHAKYFQDALRFVEPRTCKRILDAGCGPGDYSFYLAERFPHAEVLGVDIDPCLVERNRETCRMLGLSNLRFEQGDLSSLDLRETIDFIVCVDVLEHIPDQRAALSCLRDSLTSSGVAFLHIPTVREKPVVFSRWLHDFHQWAEEEHVDDDLTPDEFRGRVTEAGFRILDDRRTFGRYTGELATSIFSLFFADTTANRIAQGMVAPACRLLAVADGWDLERTRYALAIVAGKDQQAAVDGAMP